MLFLWKARIAKEESYKEDGKEVDMELWQQEALRQERCRVPLCQCCAEPVRTELFLDLRPFGLPAVACQRCVERNTHSEERSRYV